MEDRVRVAVVGCGLIGRRRAEVVQRSPDDELVIVADVDEGRAKSLAREMGCLTTTDWQEAVARDDVDVIIAATPNKYLMPITVAALDSGKHVLCEKPPGRNPTEARQMVDAAQRSGRILKIGFNHRHHPAIWKAHELCAQGAIGPLTFIRAVYGHGGRPGYDREWRADPDLAGGGELLDQGVHIVDLCRWFLGEFAEVFGFVGTYFWNLGYAPVSDKTYAVESQTVGRVGRRPYRDQAWRSLRRFLVSIRPFRFAPGSTRPTNRATPISEPHPPSATCGEPGRTVSHQLEDNAFVLLRTADGRVAQWHTSWTQWKNRFTFEVFGREGYVRVDGLGGSYGIETLTVGYRRPESGPPKEERFEFTRPDPSWQAEWQEFVSAIREGRQPLANGEEGLEAMRLIAAIYESARTGKVVSI